MHGPLEQEITYSRDGKPNTVTVYPRHSQENSSKRGNQADASERVMRTVYLPAANADNLMLKVESLQAQLSEQVRSRICFSATAVYIVTLTANSLPTCVVLEDDCVSTVL